MPPPPDPPNTDLESEKVEGEAEVVGLWRQGEGLVHARGPRVISTNAHEKGVEIEAQEGAGGAGQGRRVGDCAQILGGVGLQGEEEGRGG